MRTFSLETCSTTVFEQAVIEMQELPVISCSELDCGHCLSLITVVQRTSNLSCMIIRCIHRMKQAYVHVLIFTELTLCFECSLSCFAFIQYKKGGFFFMNASIGCVTLLSVSTMKDKPQRSTIFWTLILLQSESSYFHF